jgi:hypothetical protein
MNMQGTPEWLAMRAGYATASRFADILAKGEGKMRAKYLRQVLAERLCGKPMETYRNGHMDRGNEQEPWAREAYEIETGRLVEQVGFLPHPAIQWCGCSPDGLIDQDGGGEFKCVIPTVQIETIQRGNMPPEHRAQVQGNLFVTGRAWWDFASFSPDMPDHLRLCVYRVKRDETYIALLDKEVRAFLAEVDKLERELRDRRTLEEKLIASIEANHVGSQA